MKTRQLPSRRLVWAWACALLVMMSASVNGAQSSADTAAVENAKKALQQRDFPKAIEILKPVRPATPGMATMMAVANGMACEKDVLGDGGKAAKNPHCIHSKIFFTRLLQESASDGLALNWMGMLSYLEMTGSIEELSKQVIGVRGYYSKLRAAHPNDTEAIYWLGVTSWLSAYWNNTRVRKTYQSDAGNTMSSQEPLPERARSELVRVNGAMVNDGIAGLQKLIAKNDRDMYSTAYLSYLYRQRADLQASPAERAKDRKRADELAERATKLQQDGASTSDVPLLPQRVPPPPPPPPPAKQ